MPDMRPMVDAAPGSERPFEKDGLVWLLVGAVGFFFGMGWVTGPLGWYFGKKLRGDCESAGVGVPDTVRAAWIVGIITTVLAYLALLVILVVFVVFGAVFLGAAGAGGA